ncbi:MAG: phosphoribosylformylglycinamidine synthase subunit PurL [Elusimicrobia bacterium]|nr:phosphoribosylformylglycinamidine synthase subunit PurL [Elusimicrobiota bacterium]
MPVEELCPTEIPLRSASPKELAALSRRHGWSLSDDELAAVQAHFKAEGREPTRAELETVAQTWSEHCKHKTFASAVRYSDGKKVTRFKNLLKETVFEATQRLKKPWCLSVFRDNAGVVAFDDDWAVAFKVETHNHPCAVEPYGGAATGVGGVIRDILGVGLGAKPVFGTDVFCLCPPDYAGPLPEDVNHPRRTFAGVVSGVRDYGNRMGIPTVGGAVHFDPEFRFNPLVFCGTVGVMPRWAVAKRVQAGDLIVAIGGRTGLDGLHGATFSSAALDDSASPAAVQIGHAIVEKRVLDVLLKARDQRLYRSVTDCGAGGFSSAVGELGCDGGARVELEKAALKASDLEPWEIWVSESQERMVLAVPPKNLKALEALLAAEDVEWSALGQFTGTGRLEVTFDGKPVVDLSMAFLHDGLPRRERAAVWDPPARSTSRKPEGRTDPAKVRQALYDLIGHWNVCSRAWVIRQYDHEVQGGAVIKALQGVEADGPGDAAVVWPHAATGKLDEYRGLAVAHGLNPAYGRLDPYAMALCCADEALRNLVCVGADITRAAFLDNFCWGNPEDPRTLGGLVRAALGCRDAALAFHVPFISGKDSLYNQYQDAKGARHDIPGTLLISALAPVHDFRKAVTMDFKAPNNPLYLLGWTSDELGGSLYADWQGRPLEGRVPEVEPASALEAMIALSAAIGRGAVASCHDLSEGGLAVAAAEMAFSGELGAMLDLDEANRTKEVQTDEVVLFSESPSRFLIEVPEDRERDFLKAMKGQPAKRVGSTLANPVLRFIGMDGSTLLEDGLEGLKGRWNNRMPEAMTGRPANANGRRP